MTKSILARPTAVRTSTITFVATSTSTPAETLQMSTAPQVTVALTATDTITRTETPLWSDRHRHSDSATDDGDSSQRLVRPACPVYQFSVVYFDPTANWSERYRGSGLDGESCCQVASAYLRAALWNRDTSDGACSAGIYPFDQFVSGSPTAFSALRLVKGNLAEGPKSDCLDVAQG